MTVLVHIVGWILLAAALGWLVSITLFRTDAGAGYVPDALERGYYAAMMARGREVSLPRTWRSEGIAGHDRRRHQEIMTVLKWLAGVLASGFGLAAVAGLASGGWGWSQTAGLAGGLLLVVGFAAGMVLVERRGSRRFLEVSPDVPRTEANVVANAHGLFVPVGDGRVLQGSWDDWAVTDACFRYGGKAGVAIYGCDRLSVRHRDQPDLEIPLVASMFPDGEALMDVVAARAERLFAPAAVEARPSGPDHAEGGV